MDEIDMGECIDHLELELSLANGTIRDAAIIIHAMCDDSSSRKLKDLRRQQARAFLARKGL